MSGLPEYDHPTWLTIASTVAGYGVILIAMTVVLFLIPYLIFTAL